MRSIKYHYNHKHLLIDTSSHIYKTMARRGYIDVEPFKSRTNRMYHEITEEVILRYYPENFQERIDSTYLGYCYDSIELMRGNPIFWNAIKDKPRMYVDVEDFVAIYKEFGGKRDVVYGVDLEKCMETFKVKFGRRALSSREVEGLCKLEEWRGFLMMKKSDLYRYPSVQRILGIDAPDILDDPKPEPVDWTKTNIFRKHHDRCKLEDELNARPQLERMIEQAERREREQKEREEREQKEQAAKLNPKAKEFRPTCIK